MTTTEQYDEAAALTRSVAEIHDKWKCLRNDASSGRKSWLTQMKKHYARIINADPEAAAELLAMYEDPSNFLRKEVRR
jgi:hypothetical protein